MAFRDAFSKKPTQSTAGFTIIELLIVLAIAGFILLLVFEAIPTLTRNSHNGVRKQEVTLILADVSHYELNNEANIPPDCGYGANPNCDANGEFLFYDSSKLTFYVPSQQQVIVKGESAGATPSPNPNTDPNTVYIYNYQRCSSTTNGASTPVSAGYTDVVALYALETNNSGGTTAQCEQL